jgi:hypothetical protein
MTAALSPSPVSELFVADALKIVPDGEEREIAPSGVTAFGDLCIDGLHEAGRRGDLDRDGVGHGLKNGNPVLHLIVTYRLPIGNHLYGGYRYGTYE